MVKPHLKEKKIKKKKLLQKRKKGSSVPDLKSVKKDSVLLRKKGFFFTDGSHCVVQIGLKLLGSRDPPASTS